MRGLLLAVSLIFFSVAAMQGQKGKKVPDVQILEVKTHRGEEKVSLDGKVKVTGEKPLHGLILTFDFLDHDNAVLSSEKGEVSDETLAPGETPSFHVETRNPPGSIKFKMRAFDSTDKELRIANGGPFIIE